MTSPYTAVNEVRTTHTPGPWKLLAVGDGAPHLCPADAAGVSLLTVVHEGSTAFAAVWSDEDARLFAAAPELLKVAHMCADLAERWGDQGPLVQAARAAIASAESSS